MFSVIGSFLGDPLPVAYHWLWLVFPICLTVSLVYKTTKAERFRDIFAGALALFVTMIGGLMLVAIALWLLRFL